MSKSTNSKLAISLLKITNVENLNEAESKVLNHFCKFLK